MQNRRVGTAHHVFRKNSHLVGNAHPTQIVAIVLLGLFLLGDVVQAAPDPPINVIAEDHPFDEGEQIDVTFILSPDDVKDAEPKKVERYVLEALGGIQGEV